MKSINVVSRIQLSFLIIAFLGFALNFLCINKMQAQTIIKLTNSSFEDSPGASRPPSGWIDCGAFSFQNESAPDIQPSGAWEVRRPAQEGRTYLGMVVRENNSWESVSQQLSEKLIQGKSYSFSIYLCTSETYLSGTKKSLQVENYNTPAKLRIWGGNGYCSDEILLADSELVTNTEWKKYNFTFNPSRTVSFIILEVFYKTPFLDQAAYNGNILLDNASNIVEILNPNEEVKSKTPLTLLNNKNIKKGQTVRMDEISFQADKSNLNDKSFITLNKIVSFMKKYPSVIIEVGGHTNGIPSEKFCNELSAARAKTVAQYIIQKGIKPFRVTYKGYGKSKPLASDKTLAGRQKNQRVEIKILET